MTLRMRCRRTRSEQVRESVREGLREGRERASKATARAVARGSELAAGPIERLEHLTPGYAERVRERRGRRAARAGFGVLALVALAALATGLYLWWQRRREDEEFARLMRAPARPDVSPAAPPPPPAPAPPVDAVPPAAEPEPVAPTPEVFEAPVAPAYAGDYVPPQQLVEPPTGSITPLNEQALPRPAFSQVEPPRHSWNTLPYETPAGSIGSRSHVPHRAVTASAASRTSLPGRRRVLL
jgi:hypothetical protein